MIKADCRWITVNGLYADVTEFLPRTMTYCHSKDNDILPQNKSASTASAGVTAQTQGQVSNSDICKVVSADQYKRADN